jgi:GNAT superfamily N-acetyltransferase
MPAEELSSDDLLTVLWDDPGVVLADPAGRGLVAAVTRPFGDDVVGFVRLVAVHPDARRRGLGTTLLAGAECWLRDAGAGVALLGGDAPCYLWPGVDASLVGMQCLAEAAGYGPTGSEINMALPTSFRAGAPDDVDVVRVDDLGVIAETAAFVHRSWPEWMDELHRGIEDASVFAAVAAGGAVLGFCCHSVNRAGWLGPMGTDPDRRGGGVGAALVGAVCEDLQVAGRNEVEISWVGPVRFYAKLGADVSHVYRTYLKQLG